MLTIRTHNLNRSISSHCVSDETGVESNGFLVQPRGQSLFLSSWECGCLTYFVELISTGRKKPSPFQSRVPSYVKPRRANEGICRRSTLRRCVDKYVTEIRCDVQKIPPHGPGDLHRRFVSVKHRALWLYKSFSYSIYSAWTEPSPPIQLHQCIVHNRIAGWSGTAWLEYFVAGIMSSTPKHKAHTITLHRLNVNLSASNYLYLYTTKLSRQSSQHRTRCSLPTQAISRGLLSKLISYIFNPRAWALSSLIKQTIMP